MATLCYVHYITQWQLECGLSSCEKFLNEITDEAVFWGKFTAQICMCLQHLERSEFCYIAMISKRGQQRATFTLHCCMGWV